ncbi:MAG: CoA-binding protein [Acidobacteria bacterium]|nr:CoA-binding protein [Acidobacteriota bacterium]
MTSRAAVDAFLAQRTLALAGASRSGKKFGNTILRELRMKGYEVIPVHPEAEAVDGVPCVPSLARLPAKVGGLVLVVPPAQTERLVVQAVAAGIPRVWMQQGAESPEALRLCREAGLGAVAGECILMFAEPTGFFHRLHRGLWRLLGKLPANDA